MRQKVWRVPHSHPLTLRKETGKWYAFSMQWVFRIKLTCFLRVFRRFRAFYSSVFWCCGTHWDNWKIRQKIAITNLFKLWLMVMKLHFSPRRLCPLLRRRLKNSVPLFGERNEDWGILDFLLLDSFSSPRVRLSRPKAWLFMIVCHILMDPEYFDG